jgi:hypothetical protein
MDKDEKTKMTPRDKIANRMAQIAETIRGTELRDLKREFFKLEHKVQSQTNSGSAGWIDREIKKMLDDLPGRINEGNKSVIKNYIKRLNSYVEKRALTKRGELRMLKGLFNRKQRSKEMSKEQGMFELENIMNKGYDMFDKLVAERDKFLDEASDYNPGDPRREAYAERVKGVNHRIVGVQEDIKAASKALGYKIREDVVNKSDEIQKDIDRILAKPDELINALEGAIARKKMAEERNAAIDEAFSDYDKSTLGGSSGDKETEAIMQQIDARTEMKQNIKVAELLSSMDVTEPEKKTESV